MKMQRKEEAKYEFQNKYLENIRKGYISGEIYQAIKRIQRNSNPIAQFFIVNGDEKVFDVVKKQLMNVNVIEPIKLDIQTQKEKTKKETQSTNNKELIENVIRTILAKEAGKYKKRELEEEAGIPKSHLSKYFNQKIPEVAKHLGKEFRIERTVIIRQ
jgi:copper chaperone CopZ